MTNLVIRSLSGRGRFETAYKVAMNHLDNVWEVFRATGTLWENYAPEEAKRGNISRPEFVGWTGCGPIEALLETVIGIRADASTETISWTSLRSDRHGVTNLRLGSNVISLDLRPQASSLHVEAVDPFTLKLVRSGRTSILPVDAGRTKFDLTTC